MCPEALTGLSASTDTDKRGVLMEKAKNKGALPASMTVEVSLVLPFFLFLFVNILGAFILLRLQCDMEAAFHQAGTKLAQEAFDVKFGASSVTGDAGGGADTAANAYAALRAPSLITDYLGTGYLDNSLIEGGSGGISFLQTAAGFAVSDDIIDITGTYEVHPLINLVRFDNFTMQTRFYGHAWTGFDLEDEARRLDEHGEELVYITEKGTVYHRDLSCSHLKLSVQTADMSELSYKRSTDGEKYRPCEYCGARKAEGTIFITNYGNRYHCSINCPELKRTIYTVPISQVGGRGPCSTCAR